MTTALTRRDSAPHAGDSLRPPLVPSPVAHGLSWALAVVAVCATAPLLLVDGILLGPPVMNGSARGTALVMLALGVPLLLAAQQATRRGITWALPVWLGAVAYLLYNAFMLLFGTPFNSLFLVTVATFSLALWTLVALLRVIDVPALADRLGAAGPRRAVAVFAWLIVGLNTAAWLRGIVAGLGDPQNAPFLEGTGLTTLPTYVQDLGVWLPLMAVAAWWLWRGLAWGYLVVAAMLTQWVVEGVTVCVDQLMGSAADPGSTVASAAIAPAFAVLALVTLVPLVALLRRM